LEAVRAHRRAGKGDGGGCCLGFSTKKLTCRTVNGIVWVLIAWPPSVTPTLDGGQGNRLAGGIVDAELANGDMNPSSIVGEVEGAACKLLS